MNGLIAGNLSFEVRRSSRVIGHIVVFVHQLYSGVYCPVVVALRLLLSHIAGDDDETLAGGESFHEYLEDALLFVRNRRS